MASRILMVDGKPDTLAKLESLLKANDLELIVAANPEDACNQLEQRMLALEKAHEQLQTSESLIQTVSNNLPDGMIYRVVIGNDGTRKFTHVSDSVRKLHGISPEEALADATLIYSSVHEDDIELLMKAEIEALKNMSTFQMDVRIKTPSGDIRWSSLTSTPTLMKDGSICWDGIELVITARKRAEENLRERYKELNCLYSIADLIGKTNVLEDLLQKIANQIPSGFYYPEYACARIIVKDREFKTVNFKETAWKLSAGFVVKGVPFGAVDVCYLEKMPDRDKGPFVNEEKSLVQAVAEHLGRVIERKKIEQDSARLILELQKAMSEIKTLGGLIPICASCKKIRDDQGYWNQLELYLGEHSDLEFSHGICPECSKKLYPDVKEETKMIREGKSVILIVDDEADFRTIFIWQIKKMIKDHAFEFVEAGDGEEALELFKKGLKPSVIFLDNAMPKIDGMELLKRMDREYPDLYDVPRVMLSGYSQEKVISEAEKLRCTFFDKNMDQKTLYQQIGQHIATKLGFG